MSLNPFELGLVERVRTACGPRSVREVAELTGTHAETTRRYLRGLTAPTAEFLASLCAALDLSGDWLLCGRGRPAVLTSIESALAQATPPQLLTALAESIERERFAGAGAAAENAACPGEPAAADAGVRYATPTVAEVPSPVCEAR